MTAGRGISHTEVAPDIETKCMQQSFGLLLPDDKRNMEPKFEHYPELPVVSKPSG